MAPSSRLTRTRSAQLASDVLAAGELGIRHHSSVESNEKRRRKRRENHDDEKDDDENEE